MSRKGSLVNHPILVFRVSAWGSRAGLGGFWGLLDGATGILDGVSVSSCFF